MGKQLIAMLGGFLFLSPNIAYSQSSIVENSGNGTVIINGKRIESSGSQKIRVKSDGSIIKESDLKVETNPQTLALQCLIDEKTYHIILSNQKNDGSEAPLAIYIGSQKFYSFADYKTTELSYSAYNKFRIGDQKLLANRINIDRLSGEVVFTQKVLSVFGGLAKSKKYQSLDMRGVCNKSVVKPIPQKF